MFYGCNLFIPFLSTRSGKISYPLQKKDPVSLQNLRIKRRTIIAPRTGKIPRGDLVGTGVGESGTSGVAVTSGIFGDVV